MRIDPEHKGVMLYFTTLMDRSREPDLHRWYLTTHIPDVSSTPGISAYHRFVNAREEDDERRFCVLVEVDREDIEAVVTDMNNSFGTQGNRERLRQLIEEGRLINYGKSTFQAFFRRIL